MDRIEGFALAGGQSQRMGQDKANLMLGGKTLLERSAIALSAIADPIYVVGNLTREQTLLPIIPDEQTQGNVRCAIVGLYTAFVNARTNWVAILACDLPFVSGALLKRMAEFLTSFSDNSDDGPDALLVEQFDGRTQPLCGLYRRQPCLVEVENMLREDNRRLQDLSQRINAHIIKYSEVADLTGANYFFVNINTPEDYQAAVAIESDLN
jgi:molybdopterin-guanine dinucleotide biosynthesis protein A